MQVKSYGWHGRSNVGPVVRQLFDSHYRFEPGGSPADVAKNLQMYTDLIEGSAFHYNVRLFMPLRDFLNCVILGSKDVYWLRATCHHSFIPQETLVPRSGRLGYQERRFVQSYSARHSSPYFHSGA